MNSSLDIFTEAYNKDFEYELDNQIILNWYPTRIMQKTSATDSVLELGLGHGYTYQRFELFYKYYSVLDGSQKVIDEFKHNNPNTKANIIHTFFEEFQSSFKYDVIIMGFILEHVNNPAYILNHYKSMLADKGKCFISVPNAESLHRRFGFEAGLLDDLYTLGDGDIKLGHKRLYSVNSLTKLLEDNGYSVLTKEGIFLKPVSTNQMLSLNLKENILNAMCRVGVNYPELCAGLLFEAVVNK